MAIYTLYITGIIYSMVYNVHYVMFYFIEINNNIYSIYLNID